MSDDIQKTLWRTFCEEKYDPNAKCPACGGVLSDLVQGDRVQRKCTSFCGDTYYQRFSPVFRIERRMKNAISTDK
jgi:hypothetical protein